MITAQTSCARDTGAGYSHCRGRRPKSVGAEVLDVLFFDATETEVSDSPVRYQK